MRAYSVSCPHLPSLDLRSLSQFDFFDSSHIVFIFSLSLPDFHPSLPPLLQWPTETPHRW